MGKLLSYPDCCCAARNYDDDKSCTASLWPDLVLWKYFLFGCLNKVGQSSRLQKVCCNKGRVQVPTDSLAVSMNTKVKKSQCMFLQSLVICYDMACKYEQFFCANTQGVTSPKKSDGCWVHIVLVSCFRWANWMMWGMNDVRSKQKNHFAIMSHNQFLPRPVEELACLCKELASHFLRGRLTETQNHLDRQKACWLRADVKNLHLFWWKHLNPALCYHTRGWTGGRIHSVP